MLVIGIVFVLVFLLNDGIDVFYFFFIDIFFLMLIIGDDLEKFNVDKDIVLNVKLK